MSESDHESDRENHEIQSLFDNNRRWAETIEEEQPGFFAHLAKQQRPRFLWIGCSDSRVPANEITGLMPGEVFVHRNVANVVLQTDLNCMAVIEYAIHTLQVRHVIVCGHYGCGGVRAAMEEGNSGVIDYWLSGIRDLRVQHAAELQTLAPEAALARLCELNVRHQLRKLCHAIVVKQAWLRGQPLDLHGWIYGVEDGLLRDLGERFASAADVDLAQVD